MVQIIPGIHHYHRQSIISKIFAVVRQPVLLEFLEAPCPCDSWSRVDKSISYFQLEVVWSARPSTRLRYEASIMRVQFDRGIRAEVAKIPRFLALFLPCFVSSHLTCEIEVLTMKESQIAICSK